jgi:hypothetical protein
MCAFAAGSKRLRIVSDPTSTWWSRTTPFAKRHNETYSATRSCRLQAHPVSRGLRRSTQGIGRFFEQSLKRRLVLLPHHSSV